MNTIESNEKRDSWLSSGAFYAYTCGEAPAEEAAKRFRAAGLTDCLAIDVAALTPSSRHHWGAKRELVPMYRTWSILRHLEWQDGDPPTASNVYFEIHALRRAIESRKTRFRATR